jgi:glycine dehydrogenase
VAAGTQARALSDCFAPSDTFVKRHVGPTETDVEAMLKVIGFDSLDALIQSTVPNGILLDKPLTLSPAMGETEAITTLKKMMSKNVVNKSFIGMGYYETITPPVIQRNVLENPGWYTAYTPYQAEIAQGRLQSLLNFQTMVSDLTAMKMCNASLLDEATAAAEAMAMTYAVVNNKDKHVFFVDKDCHPQTIGVVQTRASGAGLTIEVGDAELMDFSKRTDVCGVLVQYPNTYGVTANLEPMVARAHAGGALVVASTDLMASALLKPVGEMGCDIAIGSSQRFGVPMGFGGPHAAFLATTDAYSRKMPGRIIGVSKDSRGKPALRMAMQTREQHIRRDKATSNICTAQALLANMAAMYGVYHGPDGIKEIATRIHGMACATASTLKQAGYKIETPAFFDTFVVDVSSMDKTALEVQQKAASLGVNVRVVDINRVGISFGEAITRHDTECLLSAFEVPPAHLRTNFTAMIPPDLLRTTEYMTHPVFTTIESETQMLRYLKKLENMDLSLNTSMIALGSCTMKLNATSEMLPVSWPEVSNIHPFAPEDQTAGFREVIASLHKDLAEITGFAAVSSQPNSGANGEYAGLLAIRSYHASRGESHRNICLIPVSAHGTNPASAHMVGMKVQVIKSNADGDIDMKDLREKVEKHKNNLGALMITYPSTFGKYDEEIKTIVDLVHANGGQLYMDGANMNAQCGITSPGFIGADVCHLNLHKTFCIPHGGGKFRLFC